MGVYKQLNNVKYYNKNGQRIDPFCHDDFTAMLYDNAASVTSALLEFTGGEFITPYSNSLACFTDEYATIDQNDVTNEPVFLSQWINFELYMGSQDNSVLVDLTEGDEYNPPTWNLAVDLRSDDSSISIIQKTDSQTSNKYFDLAVNFPTIPEFPTFGSSDESLDITFNSSTNAYDFKSDIRSDDSSVNITQKTDGQTDKKYLDLSVSVPTLQSSNDSININYDSVNNQYDATLDVRSDNTTIYVKQKTDANTNKSYLNIDVIKAEAQSLMTSGLRATGFSINYYYARYTPQGESSEKILGWKVAQNSYVPLFRIFAHNNGKSSIMFEIIGREDTFGYYARYYFSSRIQNAVYYPEGISSVDYPAGISGSTYTDNQNQTRTYPYNYYFMGNCEMVASDRADVFNPSDIVVVECGSNSSNGANETGSVYMIYKKIRQAPGSGNLSNDFFTINTLCYDKPSYCDIQFYFCSEPVHKYASTSLFPATGNTGELYVDTTNKKVYKWDTSSNAYVEYESDFNYRLFDNSFIPFEAVLSSPSAPFTTVGLTTFTDRLTGETKNIADYAISATFPSNNP